jgi:hypothetical protein
MDETYRQRETPSYAPCTPEEFSGRDAERERIRLLLTRIAKGGQAVMISGPSGIGKSSLLNRIAYEISEHPGGPASPALRSEVFEMPGMIFSVCKDLLKDLRGDAFPDWFLETIRMDETQAAIRRAADLLDAYTAILEPVGLLSRRGEELIGVFARSPEVRYEQVYLAFSALIRALGESVNRTGHCIAILLDDLHLASDLDRRLLQDLLQDLPAGLLLIFTCRTDESIRYGYEMIRADMRRLGFQEIALSGFYADEIRDMASRRFNLAIADSTAKLLQEYGNEPFRLMVCFTILRNRGLLPSSENMTAVLAETSDPAAAALAEASTADRDRSEALCVLNPPIPVPIIACMLQERGASIPATLDRMAESSLFRRLEGGGYDFAHPLLSAHCSSRLSPERRRDQNARAADCFEEHAQRLSDTQHTLLSLADHLFLAGEHEKAMDLNLELGARFHQREDNETALMLTQRAIVSATALSDSRFLSVARDQEDRILERVAGRVRPVR